MGSAIEEFEDLECWKEARVLVRMVYRATTIIPFSKDFGLKDQIQRAAISVMANIAEGFENYTNQEFIKFLGYSLRSCSEVHSHLYAASDLDYLSPPIFQEIIGQTKKCTNYIKAFIRYLKEMQ